MKVEVKQIRGGVSFWFGGRYVAFRLPPKKRRAEWRPKMVKYASYALWLVTHEPAPRPDVRDPKFDHGAFLRSELARKGWRTRFRNEVGRAYEEFLAA